MECCFVSSHLWFLQYVNGSRLQPVGNCIKSPIKSYRHRVVVLEISMEQRLCEYTGVTGKVVTIVMAWAPGK